MKFFAGHFNLATTVEWVISSSNANMVKLISSGFHSVSHHEKEVHDLKVQLGTAEDRLRWTEWESHTEQINLSTDIAMLQAEVAWLKQSTEEVSNKCYISCNS